MTKEHFKKSKVVFNPCMNKSARTLLYLRYSYRGLEKTLLYDFSREVLTVPHDVMA